MRFIASLLATAVLVATVTTATAASVPSAFADLSFDISPDNHHVFDGHSQHRLVRRRRAQRKASEKVPTNKKKQALVPTEDASFWERMLQDGSIVDPTPAPVEPTPPPVTPPSACPTTIEVECVAADGGTDCTDITPPASGSGADCIQEVEFSYSITNEGTEVERIYSLVITRDGETTDITDTFPLTDLAPGATTIILESVEVDICEGGAGVFETEAAFTTGPPCDVSVRISCVSEEGDECRSLPQATNPDECLIDITYTYTVDNTGDVDANIILFERTRNGDELNLLPLLDDTFLPVGDQTSVDETEEIDRCVQQSFATNTQVAQIPNADLLCDDVGFYISEMDAALPDIVDTAIAAGSFTTLAALLTEAGLVDVLRGEGPFTVFAPSDEAFGFTGDSDEAAAFIEATSLEDLTSILLYHVIPGATVFAADLVDGAMVATAQGDTVEISLPPPMVNDINIVTTDIEASNGIIHVIDGILMPGA